MYMKYLGRMLTRITNCDHFASLSKWIFKSLSFGWSEMSLLLSMVLPADMKDGNGRLLSKSVPVIEVCEAFHSRKCNRKLFRQRAHRLRCAVGRGMYGKAHLQH